MNEHIRRLLWLSTVAAAVLGVSVQSAWTAPILSWSYDKTDYFVEYGDSGPLSIEATLRSDPSSDAVTILGVGASFTGDLQKRFSFEFGDFAPLRTTLLPGHKIHFLWGTLTPIGSPAPGNYDSNPGDFLGLNLAGIGYVTFIPPSALTVHVREAPEPASFWLLGIGVIGAIRTRLVANRSRGRRRLAGPVTAAVR